MDTISEQRLTLVHPILAERVRALADSLGFIIRVTQGFRDSAAQAELYAQGRTAPGRIVTNAPPSHSWHNYGLAVDVVPMLPNPDWNEGDADWQAIVSAARSFKLLDGSSFHDEPHLQPIEIPVSPTPLYVESLSRGLPAIWAMAALI